MATVTAVSFATDCLGIVLELNVSDTRKRSYRIKHLSLSLILFNIFQGTVAAIPLAFVLPALCYVKLETESPIWSRQKLPAVFMASFGIGVSVLSIIRMISQVLLTISFQSD